MTTNARGATAKIYQFPIGRSASLGGRREVARAADRQGPERAAGGAWYHEAAISDAARTRKP